MGTAVKPKFDLQPYCKDEPRRYAINRPWRQGEYVYATDGRILVRVQHQLCECGGPDGKVPDCEQVINPMAKVRDWEFPPPGVHCEECSGIGRRTAICSTCRGTGWYIIAGQMEPCFHEDDCEAVQIFACDNCRIEFEAARFAQWYMNLVRRLPNVRVGVIDKKDERAPLYFRFDGGVGVLMGIKPD